MGRLLGLPCVSFVTVSVPDHPWVGDDSRERAGVEMAWAGMRWCARVGGSHSRGLLGLSHLLGMQCRGGRVWAGPGHRSPVCEACGGPGCPPVATHRPGALEGKGPPLHLPASVLPHLGAAALSSFTLCFCARVDRGPPCPHAPSQHSGPSFSALAGTFVLWYVLYMTLFFWHMLYFLFF